MYRTLSNSLMSGGWALVNSPDTKQGAWDQFTAATDAARARYNTAYQTAVILAAEQNAGSQQAGTSATSPVDKFIAELDPVLANWSGEVGVHIESLEGRRVDQLEGDRDYQLVVAFGHTLGDDFEYRTVDVRGGRDVDPVAFELLLDADRVRFPATGQELLVPVDGGNTTKAYKFKAPHQVGELQLGIQVLQLNRLLQVVALTVDVVAPNPDA